MNCSKRHESKNADLIDGSVFYFPTIRFSKPKLLNVVSLFAHEPGTIFLYSGGNLDSARLSFLFLFPYETILFQEDCYIHHDRGLERKQPILDNPWKMLKEIILNPVQAHPYPEWAGFLGYEMGASSDLTKRVKCPKAPTPDLYFQRSVFTLRVNHQSEEGTVLIKEKALNALSDSQRIWIQKLMKENEWDALLNRMPSLNKSIGDQPSFKLATPCETESTYREKIEKAQKMIRSGDIYQVNLSQRFLLKGESDPFEVFKKLAEMNPTSFSAYLKLPEITIVSSSPERLLRKEGDSLETRPIKGTKPRGKNEEEDLQNRLSLMQSSKDRAELLMIIDLMRNDLSRMSIPGTVKVRELYRCEAYPNVFHLLSVIESQLDKGFHPVEVLRFCFPGGSITGCPKLRAMEVIAEIEQRARGVYTGSIGYFSGNGDFDFNIAIRTIVMYQNLIDIQLGGAIVVDSDPRSEFEETLYKGNSIFKVFGFQP